MTRTRTLATLTLISIAGLTVSACDWLSSAGNDTEMKNVEILPGTASDEMITLDQANGDGTAIDPNAAIGPAQPKAAGEDADADADAADSDSDGTTDGAPDAGDDAAPSSGDVVIRPPAGGAEPDRPARPAAPAKK